MKIKKWIFIVPVVALVITAFNTYTAALENINKNEAGFRTAKRLFEMKMYEQARKILLEISKESDYADKKVYELLAKTEAEIGRSNIAVKAKPVTGDVLQTVIKKVDFTNARLDEVVGYLAAKCKVNIVLSKEALKSLNPQPIAAINENEFFIQDNEQGNDFQQEPQESNVVNDIGGITIRLKNVPLKAVLKYVLQMKGLTYIVEDYAILIVPKGYVPEEEMRTEIYRLYGGASGMGKQIGQDY